MPTQSCLFDQLPSATQSAFDDTFAGIRRFELGPSVAASPGFPPHEGEASVVGPRAPLSRESARPVAAWVEYLPGWLTTQKVVFDDLMRGAVWRAEQRQMYERVISVPRLFASAPTQGEAARVIAELSRALSARYRLNLSAVSIAHYRDGSDSVAMHGDKMGPFIDDTIVATVSVGAPRRFVMKPTAGGRQRVFQLGWGDLLVMGGSCQKTWQHGVPKLRRAEPRISIMFRPAVPLELK